MKISAPRIGLAEWMFIVAIAAGLTTISGTLYGAWLDWRYPYQVVVTELDGRKHTVRASWEQWLADYRARQTHP